MAITIVNNTQSIHPVNSVNGLNVIASSSLSADTNLKFVFDTFVQSPSLGKPAGTYVNVNRNKVEKSPTDNLGHFNIGEVLKNYVFNNFNPFLLSSSTGCTDSIRYYYYKYGEEFTTNKNFTSITNTGGYVQFDIGGLTGIAVGDEVTIRMDSYAYNPQYQGVWTATTIAGDYVVTNCPYGISTPVAETGTIVKVLHFTGTYSGKCVYNGTKQFFDRSVDWDSRFDLTGSTSQWLTNYNYSAYAYQIREDEVATLSCLVRTQLANPLLLIRYKTYDASGVQIGQYNYDVSNTCERLDIPSGTWNLAQISETNTLTSNVEPIFSSNVKSYTVQMNVGNAQISKVVTYNVICTDSRFTPLRYAFLNLQGGIDYFTFDKKWYFSNKFKREEIEMALPYDYDLNSRGSVTTFIEKESYSEVNTNWINDYENVLLRELVGSQQIYFLSNGLQTYLPVLFTVSDFNEKRTVTDNLYQYKLKNKIAYPNITQSI